MKKLIYCAAALATMFFTACQQENLEPEAMGVTYTVTLPGVQTKGENGYTEYDLYYEVYKTVDETLLASEGTQPLIDKKVPMTENPMTLSLDLLNDQDYTVLFWANKKGNAEENEWFDITDLRNVGMKPSLSNNDDRDAFCGMDQIEGHDAAKSKTVELTRPFAQLNIGTLVLSVEEAGYDMSPISSYVKVSDIPVAYNVFTAEPVGDAKAVEFGVNAEGEKEYNGIPDGYLEVDGVDDYKYVAMNYVLVPEGYVNVEYWINTVNGTVHDIVPNVPVKKNYRTNIVGNLLTSSATYTVKLLPGFEEGDYFGPEFVKEPKYNSETKTYTVTEALELKWIAEQVNSGKKDFKGETVQLAANIDLKNEPWTPIGVSTTKCFYGTFEGVPLTKGGNNYPTISNLYIENGNSAGLFGILCNGGKARNFNMNNVRISGERQLGAVAGNVYGGLEVPVIENVNVENLNITAIPSLDGQVYDNGDKVGGIVGLFADKAFVQNTSVKNATFRGYRDLGGIVGSTQNGHAAKLIGNTVENLTFIITGFYTPYADDAESGHYAPIRGGRRSNAGDVIEDNTGNDITLHTVLIESTEGSVYDIANKVYSVTSPKGLSAALSGAGAAGAGDHTIQILSDLDMTGVDWTPINVDGYNGADIVTVEGNGATIKGLDGALFAGGFAGGSGIVIKDLTIDGAHMIADNTQGYGAFVNCADSMDEITLINCHLSNSTIITPNDGAAESRIGGLVGWTAGYNNQNDGPVDSYITIQNCSVTGCTLKGAGSIGGICGHAGANEATYTKIENCTVTGNTLISTDDGAWRVGAIVGTANNGQCEINEVSVGENQILQTGKTPAPWQSDLYGRFVPAGTGHLKIDGVEISSTTPTLVKDYTALYIYEDEYLIYDLAGLQDFHKFLKANTGRHPYDRVYNIMKDIDAAGWEWESINVLNDSPDAKGLVLDGKEHTISNLAVVGEGMLNSASAGSVIKNITMDGATVTSEKHNAAIFWGSVYSSVSFENVHVKNSNINGLCNTGAFVGGTYEPNNLVVTFNGCSVEKSQITAAGYDGQDPTGASGFLGKAYGSTKVKFEGENTIDDQTVITNKNGLKGGKVFGYTSWIGSGFVGTGKQDDFKDWDGHVVYPVAMVGETVYYTIDEAIDNWTNNKTLTLVADVTLSDVITLKSTEYHVLDLGIYTMTAAKGKDAISITAEGRSSASYALDIKADATNPGGITATSKAVVKTTGKSGLKDRPIIRFYNGVYNANNVISHSGSNGTNCPQFQFRGGVYNASLSANRAMIQIYGGTFNGRFFISVDSSAYALIAGGKFKYLDNLYGSALNTDKFTIGSAKGNFDLGVYVDDEGYIVVGGEVITDFGDKFAAKATNASKAGSYLPYSSAAANGLYYTNADMAIEKHGEANVVLK